MLPWKPLMTKQHLFLVNNKLYNSTLQKWYTGLGFSFCPILSKLQVVGKLKTGTFALARDPRQKIMLPELKTEKK